MYTKYKRNRSKYKRNRNKVKYNALSTIVIRLIVEIPSNINLFNFLKTIEYRNNTIGRK